MVKVRSIGLLIIGVSAIASCRSGEQNTDDPGGVIAVPVESGDYGRNASFSVNGSIVTLVDGVSIAPAENSSAVTTTRYLGPEVAGDLDGDGLEDLAFWVTQDAQGSGTFYYVVVALGTAGGYKTTNAFLVGDRIDPQSVQIRSDVGELHVNFSDRKPGEPFTTTPSQPTVLLLKVTPNGALVGLMS